MKNFTVLTSILVLGFATLGVANAGPLSVQSLTVRFGDLDLNKPQGVEALFKRIKRAARDVCSELEGGLLNQRRLHSECVEQTLAAAVARVNRPVLTQYLVERSTKPRKVSVPVTSTG